MRAVLLGASFANVFLVLFNIALGVGWQHIAMNVLCAILCYIGYIMTFKEEQ